jgi:hypothetical protein
MRQRRGFITICVAKRLGGGVVGQYGGGAAIRYGAGVVASCGALHS